LEQIRIVLADLPRMLQDVVMQAIAEQPDMFVVDAACSTAELPDALRQRSIDLAIVPLGGQAELDETADALYTAPRLKIIGITRDGRDSYLHELVPHTVALGNLAPGQLAEVIRRVARTEPNGC
jgi:DNA-binding NarL/FixJ family response regulator